MLAIPVLDHGRRGRRALAVAALALAAGAVSARALAPCGSSRHRRAPAAERVPRPARCVDLAAAATVTDRAAVVMVHLRAPSLDLAHFLGADLPAGLDADVRPVAPAAVADPQAWRALVVAMDRPAAEALAWRLRSLPPIADAYVAWPAR